MVQIYEKKEFRNFESSGTLVRLVRFNERVWEIPRVSYNKSNHFLRNCKYSVLFSSVFSQNPTGLSSILIISAALQRCTQQIRFGLLLGWPLHAGSEVAVAVGCRRHMELLFEKFDEMRRVRERTFVADFRNRLRSRNQQQPRVHQPLPDVPPVRRHLEMTLELFLE